MPSYCCFSSDFFQSPYTVLLSRASETFALTLSSFLEEVSCKLIVLYTGSVATSAKCLHKKVNVLVVVIPETP